MPSIMTVDQRLKTGTHIGERHAPKIILIVILRKDKCFIGGQHGIKHFLIGEPGLPGINLNGGFKYFQAVLKAGIDDECITVFDAIGVRFVADLGTHGGTTQNEKKQEPHAVDLGYKCKELEIK